MLYFPNFSPIAFSIGPIDVHWYGLMYLLGFFCSYLLLIKRAPLQPTPWKSDDVLDLLVVLALGVVIGGRLGYVLFYAPEYYLQTPLAIFKIWEGGMSFHGGLLGVIFAMWFYGKRHQRHLVAIADFITPVVPLGLAAGRIGNFINGELWGKITTVPWGMVFPFAGPEPRHPSQLYQFALEGMLLFIALWIYSAKPRIAGMVSAWFLIGYGIARFIVEFFRQPDAQYGYIAFDWLTMGQLLSLPMIIIGLVWIVAIKKKSQLVE